MPKVVYLVWCDCKDPFATFFLEIRATFLLFLVSASQMTLCFLWSFNWPILDFPLKMFTLFNMKNEQKQRNMLSSCLYLHSMTVFLN